MATNIDTYYHYPKCEKENLLTPQVDVGPHTIILIQEKPVVFFLATFIGYWEKSKFV